MNSISDVLNLTLNNRYYREYLKLLLVYGRTPRFKSREIKFLNYKVSVVDCLSFIYQYKEIFVKQYYLFESDKSSPLIYDCGANIGISCLFFKRHFPDARIKAFEADHKIANIMEENLRKNHISDVEIYPQAVWTDSGGLEFCTDPADAGSIFGKGNKIKVDSVRLKDLVEQEKSKIDFLKMDIEGAETAVMFDLGDSITRVKNIFIEYHSIVKEDQTLDKILGLLSEYGFRYFINSVYEKQVPFRNKINYKNQEMDLQLNIFAYQ